MELDLLYFYAYAVTLYGTTKIQTVKTVKNDERLRENIYIYVCPLKCQ